MVDIFILLVVLAIILLAIKSSIKHFKGQGSCCGGGSSDSSKTARKRLENPVMGRKQMSISGMHCTHCASAVTNAIDSIPGANCKVNLKKQSAIVSYDREIPDEMLRKAVETAGYQVVDIRTVPEK